LAPTCFADFNKFPANLEGTVKYVATYYGAQPAFTDNVVYVVTKNIHPDNTCEYYWAIDPMGLNGFFSKELIITVDDDKKYTCKQYINPGEDLKDDSKLATGIVYSVPAEVITAISNYKKAVSVAYTFEGKDILDKNIAIKEDIKRIQAAQYLDLVK